MIAGIPSPSWNSWSLALLEHALIREPPDPSGMLDPLPGGVCGPHTVCVHVYLH